MKKPLRFLAIFSLISTCCVITAYSQKIEERTLRLTPAPNDWGKTIRGSSGTVVYRDNSAGAFVGKIQLSGLTPNHNYVLTINGKPSHKSNEKLPERYNKEGKFDFKQVTTDSAGNINNEEFKAQLPSGDYNVKFFVKDPDDWKVVLYNDFLMFRVQ